MESGPAGTGSGGEAIVPMEALTPVDGWIDGKSNAPGIQGVIFGFADEASSEGLVSNFMGSSACIKGTTVKVDLKCTPVAPATDCFGTFWGAAIGLNLNQPREGGSVGMPMPYDASALRGFAFKVTGATVPSSLRFRVQDSKTQYCSPAGKPVKLGENSFLFSDLITSCWKPASGAATAEVAKSGLVRIAWEVASSAQAGVPFDYCIESLRALR